MLLDDEKSRLRKTATARRQALKADHGEAAARALPGHLTGGLRLTPALPVSCFWPVGSEIDTRPLLKELHESGARCLLPVVTGKGQPLLFRHWHPGMEMQTASFNIPVPPEDSPEGKPRLLLVPLLAFDGAGYRLGYGGGFYDRTLAGLRAGAGADPEARPLAIGVAFSGQYLDIVPHDRLDEPLDVILTERGLTLRSETKGQEPLAHPLLR